MIIDTLTIGDISQSIIALSVFLGALSVIYNTFKKAKEKTIDDAAEKIIEEKLLPYKAMLESIDDKYKTISAEMTLLVKLNMSCIEELKNGQINGKTTQALEDLNKYMLEQTNNLK